MVWLALHMQAKKKEQLVKTFMDLVMHNVIIKFNVFKAFMKHGIMSNVNN